MHARHRPRPLALAVALAAASPLGFAATAAPTTASQWLCAADAWSSASCWSAGQLPGSGNEVTINQSGAARSDTIVLDLPGSTSMASFAMQTGAGSLTTGFTVAQTGGAVTVLGPVILGAGGYARYQLQSGSFNSGLLRVGDSTGNSAGAGVLELWSGSLQATATTLGRDGSGVLTQTGGDFHTGSLSMGSLTYFVPGARPSAVYTATSGTLRVDTSVGVGGGGSGIEARMLLSGDASAQVQQEVRVSTPNGAASLTMLGNSRLQAARLVVGADGGPGTASIGEHAVVALSSALIVGDARQKYLLSPGLAPAVGTSSLTVGASTQISGANAYIGRSSDALVTQTGNSRLSFGGDVVLADTGLGSARYVLQGGQLQATTLNLGWSTNYNDFLKQTGPASFAQSGGSVDVQALKIGLRASYQLSGGSLTVAGDVFNDGSFNATGGSFTIGGNVTNNGSWTAAATEQRFTGTALFGAGSHTTLATGSTATFEGLVQERTGAIFAGGGTKVFLGGLSIGASPGNVVESGNVDFGSANAYTAEIGGTVAGTGFDHYRVNGQLTLGGTLVITSWNGFVAEAGQQFDLLDWGTVSGQFATIDTQGLLLAPGTTLDTSQLYVNGTVAVVASVPEPATGALWVAGIAMLGMGTRGRRLRRG